MKENRKQLIGFGGGLFVCVLIWLLPIQGLPEAGRRCLALSLMAVAWWATGAMHPGFSSAALLLGYSLFLPKDVVPGSLVFQLWTTPTMYLVIGGFLLAAAVRQSGLGQRMALYLIQRFVRSYRGILLFCYVLGFALSFMIPHPWPRSFLIMSIMEHVIRAARLEKKHAVNVGLAVFAGSIPTAMILLTGDSTLNPAIASFAGVSVSWLNWLVYMGPPGLAATLLTFLAQTILFPKPKHFALDMAEIAKHRAEMGPMGRQEKLVLAVILLSVVLWATDSLHGIAPGWVAVLAVVLLASPPIRVMDAKSWSAVPMGTLLFLTAALAIGTVGKATGMNAWVVAQLLPAAPPAAPLLFALLTALICIPLHMVLGSTLAVLGIAAPAMIAFGAQAGMSPLVPAFLTYTAVALHWLLPFHHMNLLVGVGDQAGGYGNSEVFRMGLLQTAVVLVIILFEVFWWNTIGLL